MAGTSTTDRGSWNSKLGFILAAAGSAVGLGNIWGFPTKVATEGGGAYLLVYLICTFLIGFPVMVAELAIGRKSGKNPVGAFKALSSNKFFPLVGLWGVICGVMILSFYTVIAGWAFGFAFEEIFYYFGWSDAANWLTDTGNGPKNALIASVFMQFPGQDSFLYRICILFLVFFVSIGLRRLKLPSWHLYIASWSVLACLSILALQASFAKLAFFAGSMSAVAGAMFVLQIVKPKETKSVQILFGVLIVGCGMCGAAYDPSRAVPLFAWFLPMAGITLAAVVYFLCKTKYKAAFSIAALELCILFSVIWTFLQMTPNEEMWP